MNKDETKAQTEPPLINERSTRPRLTDVARVTSDALLGRRRELIIEHAGREYRLRQTSTGKLILTA